MPYEFDLHRAPTSRRQKRFAALLALTLIATTYGVAVQTSAAVKIEVLNEVHHDTSPPLRSMRAVQEKWDGAFELRRETPPLKSYPQVVDPIVRSTRATTGGPRIQRQFAGLGQGDYGYSVGVAPPDTVGAVGATQYVQWINLSFAVFDKATGALTLGPLAGNTLWQGFGGTCASSNNGDPVVSYDRLADRWVMSQFALSGSPDLECVAVSKTNDATGAWNRYSFSYPSFPDYPKMGVWPNAYMFTFNMFGSPSGGRICGMDRAAMLAGTAATQQCAQLSNQWSLVASDVDGTTAPPAGEPAMIVNYGANSLNLWRFNIDFATPGNSTFTGPVSIPVAPFTPACHGATIYCIPQPGTTTVLDSLMDVTMFRLAYRKFPDGHEAMVVNHAVDAQQLRRDNTLVTVSGIRWYEIRNATGQTLADSAVIHQQGTYAPGGAGWRWMGSIAMDKAGDIGLGFSLSSPADIYPGLAFTGRTPADALGAMQVEQYVFEGKGSQTGLNRWGDYSDLTVDPVDDCTFWYTGEYLKQTGSFNWSTRILVFRFPGC